METFQKLTIELSSDKLRDFYKELTDLIENSSKWKSRNDLVDNFTKNTFTKSEFIITAESKEYFLGDRNIQGIVWLWNEKNTFQVFNIIPTGKIRNLASNEYNYILNQFRTDLIDKISKDLNAKVKLSTPYKYIDDTLGTEGLSALKAFSAGANKSTGNTHPYDFQRWCEFIFIIHRTGKELSATELENWLIENGWDDEMASKLSLEFEYSIELLEKYEQSR